ncbi:MAG: bifunctional IscS subfamily cysteine desulfurase/selenide, water dikinase SelD, partial [Candidatus Cloacimonadota bacterium]
MEPIYLDYNATTPIDTQVADAMMPFLKQNFGNPSSSHWFGIISRKAVIKARKQIAELINCKTDEIIFTSGGTESNNYALRGYAFANRHKGNHIITSVIEHPTIIEICKYLEKHNFKVTYLPVDKNGLVSVKSIQRAITQNTILISIMHANNEVGTIQSITEIAEVANENGICMHTDAAQSIGKISVDVTKLNVDLLTIAGHKIYAPKGIGALFIKQDIKLEKLMFGAKQENNRRAGTENVLEIIGLG